MRKAVGDDIRIMLDVKALWSAHTALSAGLELEALGVFLVEQPLSPDDHHGAQAVTRGYQDRLGLLTAPTSPWKPSATPPISPAKASSAHSMSA